MDDHATLSAGFPGATTLDPGVGTVATLATTIEDPVQVLGRDPTAIHAGVSHPVRSIPGKCYVRNTEFFLTGSILVTTSYRGLPDATVATGDATTEVEDTGLYVLQFFFVDTSPPL